MKKLGIIIASLLMMWGCEMKVEEPSRETTSTIAQHCSRLVDLEFNGETHEYVLYICGYGKSLSHWEGCKYCKQNKDE